MKIYKIIVRGEQQDLLSQIVQLYTMDRALALSSIPSGLIYIPICLRLFQVQHILVTNEPNSSLTIHFFAVQINRATCGKKK